MCVSAWMVRLLTHNLLCSNVKGVKNPYPLQIRAEEVEHGDAEYDPVMTLRMIPKIDYGALVMACAAGAPVGSPAHKNATHPLFSGPRRASTHAARRCHRERGLFASAASRALQH